MKPGKKIYGIAAGILAAAGVVCAGIAVRDYLKEEWAGSNYEALREKVVSRAEPSADPTPEASPETTAEPTAEPVEIPIDFAALKEENPDVYAWITIPGTEVDYPVLQSDEDDSYYLTHTIEGKTAPEGAIYTESVNSRDFTDPNTVIYGHNMRNDSMFGSLHLFEDRDFFDNHRELTIYLPDEILHYQIFAAYTYDNRHILKSFDFNDTAQFQGYINSIFQMRDMSSNLDTSISVETDDRIVTLSTCNGVDDQRYLVQAVLISIES